MKHKINSLKRWLRYVNVLFWCLIPFVIAGMLFGAGHFIGGSLLFALVIVIFITLSENDTIRRENNIISELHWIAASLVDKKELNKYEEESRYYYYIRRLIFENKIKKDMDIKEIIELIRKNDKENQYDSLTSVCFYPTEEKEYKITLSGYGMGIPTPILVLEIKNGRLNNWKLSDFYQWNNV